MKLFKRICDFLAGRWYALYASGHGSSFRRDGKLMTKRTALYEADRWVGIADTIGGASQVKNIFTGNIIYPSLKIAVALAILIAIGTTAYAEVPDVSKWSCPDAYVESFPNFGVEVTYCEKSNVSNFYIKVSGELVYVHEHRTGVNSQAIYYNALKLKTGDWWVEVVNERDFIFVVIGDKGITMNIVDDNDVVVAERFVPLIKK